jgi:hypothetical protein
VTPAEATTLVDIRCDAWERHPYEPAAFAALLDALDELEVAEFAEELDRAFPNPPTAPGRLLSNPQGGVMPGAETSKEADPC